MFLCFGVGRLFRDKRLFGCNVFAPVGSVETASAALALSVPVVSCFVGLGDWVRMWWRGECQVGEDC